MFCAQTAWEQHDSKFRSSSGQENWRLAFGSSIYKVDQRQQDKDLNQELRSFEILPVYIWDRSLKPKKIGHILYYARVDIAM